MIGGFCNFIYIRWICRYGKILSSEIANCKWLHNPLGKIVMSSLKFNKMDMITNMISLKIYRSHSEV